MYNWRLLLLAFFAYLQPIASFTERNLVDGREQCCDHRLERDSAYSLYGTHRAKLPSEDRRINDQRRDIRDVRRDERYGHATLTRRTIDATRDSKPLEVRRSLELGSRLSRIELQREGENRAPRRNDVASRAKEITPELRNTYTQIRISAANRPNLSTDNLYRNSREQFNRESNNRIARHVAENLNRATVDARSTDFQRETRLMQANADKTHRVRDSKEAHIVRDTIATRAELKDTRETRVVRDNRETRAERGTREIRAERNARETHEIRDNREIMPPAFGVKNKAPRDVRDTRETRAERDARTIQFVERGTREIQGERITRVARDVRDTRETRADRDIRATRLEVRGTRDASTERDTREARGERITRVARDVRDTRETRADRDIGVTRLEVRGTRHTSTERDTRETRDERITRVSRDVRDRRVTSADKDTRATGLEVRGTRDTSTERDTTEARGERIARIARYVRETTEYRADRDTRATRIEARGTRDICTEKEARETRGDRITRAARDLRNTRETRAYKDTRATRLEVRGTRDMSTKRDTKDTREQRTSHVARSQSLERLSEGSNNDRQSSFERNTNVEDRNARRSQARADFRNSNERKSIEMRIREKERSNERFLSADRSIINELRNIREDKRKNSRTDIGNPDAEARRYSESTQRSSRSESRLTEDRILNVRDGKSSRRTVSSDRVNRNARNPEREQSREIARERYDLRTADSRRSNVRNSDEIQQRRQRDETRLDQERGSEQRLIREHQRRMDGTRNYLTEENRRDANRLNIRDLRERATSESSRLSSRMNGREVSRDRDLERRETRHVLRTSEAVKNIASEDAKRLVESRTRSNMDSARNSVTFGQKNVENESTWQYIIYTIQGIYLCSILMPMLLSNNRVNKKKTRNFRWLAPFQSVIKAD